MENMFWFMFFSLKKSQNLKIWNGAHARDQTLGKRPLLERKILTLHIAMLGLEDSMVNDEQKMSFGA